MSTNGGPKWTAAQLDFLELVEENAEEHIETLTQKYMGDDRYPWRAPGDTRVIVRVRPDRVSDQSIE